MAIARPIPVGMSDDGKTLRTNLLAELRLMEGKSVRSSISRNRFRNSELLSQIRCRVLSFW